MTDLYLKIDQLLAELITDIAALPPAERAQEIRELLVVVQAQQEEEESFDDELPSDDE